MIPPCPVCRAPYGFHDEGPHGAAATRIPRHLVTPESNTQRRAKEKAERHAANQRWLNQEAAR